MSTRGRPASDPRPRSPSTAGSTSLVRVDRWSTAWPSADAAGHPPTHPGGPGRFRMRAGHQCRNDGTHVDDVRATPSGSAFQDLRNRRTQMPSTIARQVVSVCPGAAVSTSALADTLPQVAAPMRNRGLAGFVSGQLLAGPTSDTVFSWASTAWIWLRRQVSRSRGGRASGCEACRVGGGDRGGSGECLAALRAAIPSTRIQTGPVSLTGIKTAGNRQLVVQGNHRQG